VTPAVEELERAGVRFEVLISPAAAASGKAARRSRDRSEGYGAEVAAQLGLDPRSVLKTLLVELVPAAMAVALVPVSSELDLRAMARAAGAKRAAMAAPAVAERLTGYVVGGISPFGQRRRSATFVDDTVTSFERVYVSGGRRGLELAIAPSDLLAVLGAVTAPLAAR
jgi:Cys-tRNA(Pro)/Cys-tRNA(Cys) deacylase